MSYVLSLISTVFNEEDNLPALFEDINKQTYPPDEIVVVDAGSTDSTVFQLDKKSKVLIKKGCNRSEGRNLAVENTTNDFIASFDAGTRLDKNWLKYLVQPLVDGSADVVSGFFVPDAKNFFEKCLASATIPLIDEIEENKFLPSSRSVAFKKSAWNSVKGYPEWLPVCEDLIFDIKLKKKGFRFIFEPKALVYWRPRKNVQDFFKQYFLYARGDGHSKLWFVRHAIRYSAYFTGFMLLYLSVKISFLWLLPFFAAQLGYFSKFYYRYLGHFSDDPEHHIILAFPFISFLVVTGDIAKMVGYLFGIYQRLTKKVKFESY